MYKVLRQIKLPPKIVYPFVRLGAILYGGFDPERYSAIDSVTRVTVPTIFFHGDDDDYVPWEMSQENYDACTSRKELVIIPGAGHGLSFPVDKPTYLKALGDFFGPELSAKE
jgi:fermentation-respiration switch protein FrsA (DUF1100 family)